MFQDTFKKADAEKEYYVSELEKRSASLKEISRRNKGKLRDFCFNIYEVFAVLC